MYKTSKTVYGYLKSTFSNATRYLVPGTRCQVPGTRYLVAGVDGDVSIVILPAFVTLACSSDCVAFHMQGYGWSISSPHD